MYKSITDYLRDKNIIFKELKTIEPKALSSRKKIVIYDGLSLNKQNISTFYIKQSSRFLLKNAQQIIEIKEKLESYTQHKYKRSILLIDAPLCSKALRFLEEQNWNVYNDTL